MSPPPLMDGPGPPGCGLPLHSRPPEPREDPVVALIYELMRRGSVLPETMHQVVTTTPVGQSRVRLDTARDVETLEKARELARLLPWYGGA